MQLLNENKLRELVNKSIDKGLKKQNNELKIVWKYLNKLREEIQILKISKDDNDI